MEWPKRLVLIRHGESTYNELKRKKEDNPLYQDFLKSFEKDPRDEDTVKLAEQVKYLLTIKKGDNATPLTEEGKRQAFATGKALQKIAVSGKGNIVVPDKIFVSPHRRTIETLKSIVEGWPELEGIPTIEEVRIREQEHGLALTCNDWRVFQTLYPEQRELHGLEGPYWYRYPQGENVPDVQSRVQAWFGKLIRDCAGENIMVVTHHLTILTIMSALERFGAVEFMRMDDEEKPYNCGVTLYTYNVDRKKLERSFYNNKCW